MDDKKRYGGSKVSEIANRFQEKLPQKEQVISVKTRQKVVHESLEDQATVTVVRTESHVTRFNNARAMFEKLGEETKSNRDKVITVHSTKSTTSTDFKHSSNLASTARYDYFSSGSRSPSPDQIPNIQLCHNSIPKNIRLNADNIIKRDEKIFKINGTEKNRLSADETIFFDKYEKPGKSEKPKKPEKPERKFSSSKELIEKQRNWTSHFAKTRSSRYNSDPNKNDIKFVENCNNESFDNKQNGGRSASFNVKPTTSVTAPGDTSDNFKRLNSNRKERPASVIPTLNDFSKTDQTMVITSAKSIESTQLAVRKNKANSLVEDSAEHFSPLSNFKTQNSCDITSDFCLKSDLVCPTNEDNRDSLSATSESQSSLSPLSSPGNLKSELEKQEDEGNEKSSTCKYIICIRLYSYLKLIKN